MQQDICDKRKVSLPFDHKEKRICQVERQEDAVKIKQTNFFFMTDT
jgi:hypothetical protein